MIREEIKTIVKKYIIGNHSDTIATQLLKELSDKGVVIKVEGEFGDECPEYWSGEWWIDDLGNKHTIDDDLRYAGYTKTIPLIEEQNGKTLP